MFDPFVRSTDPLLHGLSSLVGEHDFSGFANLSPVLPGAHPRNPVRQIARFDVCPDPEGGGIRLEVESTGFLYRQVRNMVGVAVHVAQGRVEPGIVGRLLETADRRLAPKNCGAPPHGLFLHSCSYGAVPDRGGPGEAPARP